MRDPLPVVGGDRTLLTPYDQGYVSVRKSIPSHVSYQILLGELLLFSIIRLFRRMFTLVGIRHSPRTRMDVP